MEIKQTQKRINIHHTTSVDGILYGRSESLTYDTNGILVEHEIDWTVGDENGKGPYVTPSGPLDHISKETPASLEEKFKEIIKQQKKYTFIPNSKTSRTQSDMVDMIIDRNGKRQKL
jgi:hypothetical protein